MAATTEATLTRKATSGSDLKFLFRCLKPLKNKKSQPVISIPLVGTTPNSTFLFRFMGQSEILTFTFALFDDDTDVSDGTATPSQVKTPQQQVEWLRDSIFSAEFNTTWTIQQPSDYYASTVQVVITDLEFETISPQLKIGYITVQRGKVRTL